MRMPVIHRYAAVVVWSASILVLATAMARAQPNANNGCNVRQAKAQFELGQAHIKLGNYELAMIDFEAGYDCIPLPLFLYDIAQMARMSGQRSKALEFYKRYLAAEPTARERPYVLRWIAALTPHSKARPPAMEAVPVHDTTAPAATGTTSPMVIAPTMTAQPAAAAAPTPPSSSPAVAELGHPALSTAAAPAPSERPSHRRRWIALGVVGGVLVIGGAVTAGVLLGRGSSGSGVPSGFHDYGPIDSVR
jgi:hypothetical protein